MANYFQAVTDPWRGANQATAINMENNQNAFAQKQAGVNNQMRQRQLDMQENQYAKANSYRDKEISERERQNEIQLMGVQADVIGRALDGVKDEQSYQQFRNFIGNLGPLGESKLVKYIQQQAPPNYDPRKVEEGKQFLNGLRPKAGGGDPFTLSEGQKRFDASGKMIAEGGKKQGKSIENTVDLGDKQRIFYRDGRFEDLPKGANPSSTQKDIRDLSKTLAMQVIDGRLDPNMISKRGGLQQEVFSQIEQISPGFNIVGANANAKFATNASNLQSRALINGVEPLYDKLEEAGAALGNSSIPGANRVRNWAKLETGNPEITAFNNLRDDVIAETERILLGSGVLSDSKYMRALKNVNSAQSMPQLKAAVKQLRFVVRARLEALDKKPYQNTRQDSFNSGSDGQQAYQSETYNQAPQQATDYLKANPGLKDQFKEKYGYLPEGF